MPKSELLKILKNRGFFYQTTNLEALDLTLSNSNITLYCGFDCTAKSLHVGNLVNIMMLRWFQKFGHTPIVLVGGATSRIGDPSGKNEARNMLSLDEIEQNKISLSSAFEKFIDFKSAHFLDNQDWLCKINYLDFLREYGRYFSINQMLSFDSVKSRLEAEQNLSFLEFNYMLLQAYDFLELYKQFNCQLQIGGSDQWGNIVNGVHLSKKLVNVELFGLTCPLITTASGAKMGKSVNGAVWLNSDMRSPYEYWQFWRNAEDADVVRFLNLFTDLPEFEIARLAKLGGSEINEAKIILANEATKLCHGQDAAESAVKTASQLFDSDSGLSGDDLHTITLTSNEIQSGLRFFQLFTISGLADSNSAAKKLIAGGGAKYNNIQLLDSNKLVTFEDFIEGKIKLSAGKKRNVMVVLL